MGRRRDQKALIYVRQSTYREESISLEVQTELCLSYCQRQGYQVVGDPVSDPDLSGREFAKRSIQPLIERVRAGEASTVVVWNWSRWGRNVVESLRCIGELKKAGGVLESATEPIDASTPAGKFTVTQMLAIAEFQSDQIGENWRNAMRTMVLKKGLPPTGGSRFGYTYDPGSKTYEIDPLTGPALRECYELYRDGYSFYALALRLQNKGIVSSKGIPLSANSLRQAMDNGFAAGLVRLKRPDTLLPEDVLEEIGASADEPIFLPGSWPELISDDVWTAYRERRRSQERRPRRNRNPKQPLSGHVRCAGCNRRMIYRNDRDHWRCQSGLTSGGQLCPVRTVTITQSEVTEYVKAWLRELADERGGSFDALVAKRMRMERIHGNRETLTKQKADAEQRKANLVRAISKGVVEDDDAETEMKSIKADIERLHGALATLRVEEATSQTPKDSFKRLLASWNDSEASVLNTALAKIIDGVYVYPFQTFPRVIIRGVWETETVVPVAAAVDREFSEGRVCLGCREWKPRDQFYVRKRTNQLFSRCKECKAREHAVWWREKHRD